MIKQTVALVACIFLPSFAALAVADDKAALTQKVLKQLEGEWEIISVVSDGVKRPAPVPRKERVVIRDGKWRAMAGDKILAKGEYTIDPTKKPMTMDVSSDNGPTVLTIFEVGKNAYRVCMEVPGSGADRPTKFASEKGSGHALVTYKRIK